MSNYVNYVRLFNVNNCPDYDRDYFDYRKHLSVTVSLFRFRYSIIKRLRVIFGLIVIHVTKQDYYGLLSCYNLSAYALFPTAKADDEQKVRAYR